jgi:hypothetical protein
MQRLIYGEILSDDFYSFTYKSKERVDDLTRSFDLSFVICHLSFNTVGLRLKLFAKVNFLTNRIPLRGSKLRAASRQKRTQREERNA